MGLLDWLLFDLDGDGEEDGLDIMAEMQMTARSRKEAIELTGDDTFYLGNDDEEDDFI